MLYLRTDVVCLKETKSLVCPEIFGCFLDMLFACELLTFAGT